MVLPPNRIVVSALLAFALVASCSSVPATEADWVAAVVAADPMFGGGATLEQRLFGDPNYGPAGDPLQREQFLREQRMQHDREASEFVRSKVADATALRALTFLRSDAGNALAAAETLALPLYPVWEDDYPRSAAQAYGQRDKVGPATVGARIAGLHSDEHVSVSPLALAVLIGGRAVTPDDADAIAAFRDSELGQRWCELQCQAFPITQRRMHAFHDRAVAQGFVRWLGDPQEDLILPAAKYQEPEGGGR